MNETRHAGTRRASEFQADDNAKTRATSRKIFQAIRGQIAASDRAPACGVAVQCPSPVLTLCQPLLAAGLDPDRALEVYRAALRTAQPTRLDGGRP